MKFSSPHKNYQLVLIAPSTKEINGELVRDPGKGLYFADGFAETDDPKTIDLALKHPSYRKRFISIEREQKIEDSKSKNNSPAGSGNVPPAFDPAFFLSNASIDDKLSAINELVMAGNSKNALAAVDAALEVHKTSKRLKDLREEIVALDKE
jgi:hypothetical protein